MTMAQKLTALYSSDANAKLFLDRMAVRSKNPRGGETRTDQVQHEIFMAGGGNVSQAEARKVLKQLADIGCGNYCVGRHRARTRLIWAVSAISAGQVAVGAAATVTVRIEDATEDSGVNDQQVKHRYQLRSANPVFLELPVDLTQREAERLAQFITTLPL